MDSILVSIKKLLGVTPEDTQFDVDITIHINTALMTLNQLGIGPAIGFMITGIDETWVDFLGEIKKVEAVKTYVYLKTRLVFDPPTNAFLVEAMERQITELEWRLNAQAESIAVIEITTVEGGL